MHPRQHDTLTVNEVSLLLRVDPATVRRWLGAQRLQGVVVGGSWRVERSDVQTFVDKCTAARFDRDGNATPASVER